MTFIGKGILPVQIFYNGIHFQGLPEFFLRFLPDNLLAVVFQHIGIISLSHHLIVLQIYVGSIGIDSRLQVYRQISGRKQRVQSLQHIIDLTVFHLQLFPLFSRLYDSEREVNYKEHKQRNLKTDARRVRTLYHLLGHAWRKELHHNIITIRNISHTQIVRSAVLPADKSTFPAVFKNSLRRFLRSLVDLTRAYEKIQQIFLAIILIVRTGYHPAIRHTQPGSRWFPEIGGAENLLHILLRQIRSPNNADNLSVHPHRRKKDKSRLLIGQTLVKENGDAALSLHPARIVIPIRRIDRSAVGKMGYSFRIRKPYGVKHRISLYFRKRLRRNRIVRQRIVEEIGIGIDNTHAVFQFTNHLLGFLAHRILRIIFILFRNSFFILHRVRVE